ncbi:MAG: hypothetical protein GEU76_16685 [Alphaproteobacteria bacterium]|nr:hypothetical protein [Alphaproteobacteria bacterium]
MFAGARKNMTLGFPDHLTKWELSDAYLTEPKIIPHEIVDDGPIFENVLMGDDIDVEKFRAPIWNEKDAAATSAPARSRSPAIRKRTGSMPTPRAAKRHRQHGRSLAHGYPQNKPSASLHP